MKNKLHLYYDKEGDLLEIRIGKATKGYMKDIGNNIFEKRDEKTGEIKAITILNFNKRTKNLKPIEVSLPIDIKPSA